MKAMLVVCGLAVLVMAIHAGAVTVMIEDFNGTYVGGPIGPMPADWTYFGYGPPAYNTQEIGIVLPPNDGTNSSWRTDVPGTAGSGTIAIYRPGVDLNSYALPGQPIDWNEPVYLKADVFGEDHGFDTMFKTTLDFPSITKGSAEWGGDGVGNTHWQTLTTQVSNSTGHLVLFLDFNFTSAPFEGNSTAIWENLRMEYTPEPAMMGLLGLGGLPLLLRRRR